MRISNEPQLATCFRSARGRSAIVGRGFRLALGAVLALGVSGCAASPPPAAAPAKLRLPREIAVTLTRADDPIGTYVSKPWGFSTSSYWIEGPEGLVLIDTQFLPSAAVESVELAERVTGKKVVAAIVLHANPDKFNGTELLQKRGIRVLTSAQVLALIPEVHEKRTRAFFERYQPDYPTRPAKPESFGSATTELTLAGVPLKLHVLGPGCSEAHVVVQYKTHVFVGDLVANDAHSWLEIGKTDEWLRRLDEIAAMEPEWVHPGRGPSGGAGLVTVQRAYLKKVIAIVAAEQPKKPGDAEGIARAKAKIKEAFPGLGFEVFLEIGLPAEWDRQAKASAVRSMTKAESSVNERQ